MLLQAQRAFPPQFNQENVRKCPQAEPALQAASALHAHGDRSSQPLSREDHRVLGTGPATVAPLETSLDPVDICPWGPAGFPPPGIAILISPLHLAGRLLLPLYILAHFSLTWTCHKTTLTAGPAGPELCLPSGMQASTRQRIKPQVHLASTVLLPFACPINKDTAETAPSLEAIHVAAECHVQEFSDMK